MPRPVPPPLLVAPAVTPTALDPRDQRSLAVALGLSSLSADLSDTISHALAAFRATVAGCPDTTLGATKAALAELVPGKRGFDLALKRFADSRYGVDNVTLARLQPLAIATLAGGAAERDALALAAKERAAELDDHPRIGPRTEALRYFCGVARVIFDQCAAPDMERTRRNCRRFVLELLAIVGEDCADFAAHPERLDEYMLTDVSPA